MSSFKAEWLPFGICLDAARTTKPCPPGLNLEWSANLRRSLPDASSSIRTTPAQGKADLRSYWGNSNTDHSVPHSAVSSSNRRRSFPLGTTVPPREGAARVSRKRSAQKSESDFLPDHEILRYTVEVPSTDGFEGTAGQNFISSATSNDNREQLGPQFLRGRLSAFFAAIRPKAIVERIQTLFSCAADLLSPGVTEHYDVVEARRNTPTGPTVKRFKRLPNKPRSNKRGGQNVLPLNYLSTLPAFRWTEDALQHIGQGELQTIINFLDRSANEISEGRVQNYRLYKNYVVKEDVEHLTVERMVNLPLSVVLHNYMTYKYENNSADDFMRALNDWVGLCNETRFRILSIYDDQVIEAVKRTGARPGDRFSLPNFGARGNEVRMYIRRSADFLNFILKHYNAFSPSDFCPWAMAKVVVDLDAIHKQELPVSFYNWPSKHRQSMPGDFPEGEVFFDEVPVANLHVEELWEYRCPDRTDKAVVDTKHHLNGSGPASFRANTLIYEDHKAHPARGILKKPKRLQGARDMRRLRPESYCAFAGSVSNEPRVKTESSNTFRMPSPTNSEDSSFREAACQGGQGSPMDMDSPDMDSPAKYMAKQGGRAMPAATVSSTKGLTDDEECVLDWNIESAISMAQRNVEFAAPSPGAHATPCDAVQLQPSAKGEEASDNSLTSNVTTPVKPRRRVGFISPMVVYKQPSKAPSHKTQSPKDDKFRQPPAEAHASEGVTEPKTSMLRRLLLEQREQGLPSRSFTATSLHTGFNETVVKSPLGCSSSDNRASPRTDAGSFEEQLSSRGAVVAYVSDESESSSSPPEDVPGFDHRVTAVDSGGQDVKDGAPGTPLKKTLHHALAEFWSPDDDEHPFGVTDIGEALTPSFSDLRISSGKADDLECQRQLQLELLERTRRETVAKKAEEEHRRKEEEHRKEEEERLARTGGLRPSRRPVVAPLTIQWQAKVMNTIAARPNIELAKTPEGSPLHRHDFETVVHPTEWLNDEIVNSALLYLASYINQKAGIKNLKVAADTPKCVAFNSFVSKRLVAGADITERTLRRAGVRKDNFLDIDTILFPICEHNHWTLVVVRPSKRTVAHMDSIRRRGAGSTEVASKAMKWVQKTLSDKFVETEWKTVDHESPQQTNGHDCGVHAITNAMCVALSLDPLSYQPSQMPMQRLRLAAVLLNNGYKGEFDLDGM
ncbi:Ubl-specific protease [Pleurostoma richardsiae]|uniref:Ubl-specific protease n=1 Tax=Pleurostoma richardsiae TaxID=41990 RepID=A0AA38S3J0_9PEZI|nr:Ubl-specific protease [Pleurostoma richardsiae]